MVDPKELGRRIFPSINKGFEEIHSKRINNEDFIFVNLIKACAKKKDLSTGIKLHADILERGLLWKSSYLASTLIHMYTKCGLPAKASQVLEELPVRDVVSWNALISGYAQQGEGHEALSCFDRMLKDGVSPNSITFTSILKACGISRAVEKGKQIHEEILSRGILEEDIVLGTALVDMYAKWGMLDKAQAIHEDLPVHNVVSWSALIAGYAQNGQGHAALNCFERMQNEGLSPNAITFICILKACGSTGAIEKGKQVHNEIVNRHLLHDDGVALGNALVDMYAKCGLLGKAQYVLEMLPFRNVVTWNALIAGYMDGGQGHEALDCYERMQTEGVSPNGLSYIYALKACGQTRAIDIGQKIHETVACKRLLEKDIVLATALIDMYAKCGLLRKAHAVLEGLPARDVVSWNALITGYVEQRQYSKAIKCFQLMKSEALSPDVVSYICMLNACGSTKAIENGKEIHDDIISSNLLNKYVELGNALVDMYAKCGMLEKARSVLQELPIRNVVSWSALIAGYAQQGYGHEALNYFEGMQKEGFSPNEITFICILKACGSIGAMDKGKEIHEEVASRGLLNDVGLGNAVVEMYTKFGMLYQAQKVLEKLPFRNIVTWNTLIAGYTQHGHCGEALDCFEQMQCEGFSPNNVTFLCLLNACSHCGLLDEAQMLFNDMNIKYGIDPSIEHHTCMVVAFGCAGQFDDAITVIKVIPSLDCTIWLALLGGCGKWGNVKLGALVFDQIVQLDYSSAAAYILMTKLFSAAGMQQDAERIETMRLKYAPWKQGNSAWVDVTGRIHTFYVGDKRQFNDKRMYAKLKSVNYKIVEEGYISSLCPASYDEKGTVECEHSEKLAVVYALINTYKGENIYVVNNTQMCDGCQLTMSYISKLEKRKVMIRDPGHLHIFEGGKYYCT